MYDGRALDLAYTIFRIVLLCVAVGFWILYIRETWLRSQKIPTLRLKKGLTDLLLILSIALVTFLVFTLMSGFQSASHPRR